MHVLLVGGGYLGSAVAAALPAHTRLVVSWHRHSQRAAGLSTHTLQLDLTDPASIQAAFAGLVDLDGLVITAGSWQPGGLAALGPAAWSEPSARVLGSLLCAREAAARMPRGGNIVLSASIDACKPLPAPVGHTAAQAALAGGVRALARELGPQGVKINLVAAGPLAGGLSEQLDADLIADYERLSALGRRGSAAEVAAVIAWMLTENSYITGQTIAVDGGL